MQNLKLVSFYICCFILISCSSTKYSHPVKTNTGPDLVDCSWEVTDTLPMTARPSTITKLERECMQRAGWTITEKVDRGY